MDFTPKSRFGWSLNGLNECIKYHGMKSRVICYNDTCAIVHVKNYRESQILGAHSDWCICQHKESWDQYVEVNENRVQLFFYDFREDVPQYEQLVGATFEVTPKGVDLICCQGRDNVPIREYLIGIL